MSFERPACQDMGLGAEELQLSGVPALAAVAENRELAVVGD
jgi:hypothetical protein